QLKKEVIQLQENGHAEEAERLLLKIQQFQQEWEKQNRESQKQHILRELEEKLHHLELKREEAKAQGRMDEAEELSLKLERVRQEIKIVILKLELDELKSLGKFEEAERHLLQLQEMKRNAEQEMQKHQNRQWEEEIERAEEKIRSLRKQVAELEALGRIDEAKEVTRQIEQLLTELKARIANRKK
ncbi:MAG: hypothetical protein AABZ60_25410, partial [Planctomycetota bacterium]